MKKVSLKLLSLFISIMMVTMLLPGQTTKAETTPDGMFTYTVSEGNATIKGLANSAYTGPLNLPSTISDGSNTYTVTAIGDSAFINCSGLTGTLTIPDSVTSIGVMTFQGCSGLTGPLTIPDSVTSIGNRAFYYCSGLMGLTLPDGLTSLGDYAFAGCSGLTGLLTIPDSVTSIGNSAFGYCSGLTGTLRIPDNVTSIGSSAFQGCSNLTGLTIGNSLTSIGKETFKGCSGLTGLTIPDSVTSIGSSAFMNCSGLTGTLKIPDTVTNIEYRAFYECIGLEGLILGSSVTTIGDSAFSRCTSLSGLISIPDTVTSISSSAFRSCHNLKDINVSNENPVYSSKDGIIYNKLQSSLLICPSGRMGSFTIPNSVTIIGDFAFSTCTGLTGALTIPDTVTIIEEYAFEGCIGLDGLTLGSNLTLIGASAFSACSSINTIIAKPINAPSAVQSKYSASFEGVPTTAILYTPNTPSSNTSYDVLPWSRFVRGTLQPKAEVVSGVNRFDTAALISKRLNDSANTVILTTGRNFPDALSAGPLAVQKNAPILLAEVNKIPIETLNEITRLGASKVIILGGLGAMDSSVEATLKNLGLSVERISGTTRFLTAIETAKQVRASSGQLDRAILANGYGFADALSIGSYAAKGGIPILLTAANSLSPETKTAMVQFGIKEIDIIGGELAVSKAVEDELAVMGITVSRISGVSRFATSAAIAGMYFTASENAIVSNGRGFVDALAAVPLAVKQNAPILLVEKDSLPVVMSNYLGSSSIKNITITGGELAVSSTVKNQILNILNSGL